MSVHHSFRAEGTSACVCVCLGHGVPYALVCCALALRGQRLLSLQACAIVAQVDGVLWGPIAAGAGRRAQWLWAFLMAIGGRRWPVGRCMLQASSGTGDWRGAASPAAKLAFVLGAASAAQSWIGTCASGHSAAK
jgi:hypothetical protein